MAFMLMRAPVGSVPCPGVVERPALALIQPLTAEQDHHVMIGVVDHGSVVACRRTLRRGRLVPHVAVVDPGVGRNRAGVGSGIPPEEHDGALVAIAGHAWQTQCRRRSARGGFGYPAAAIEAVDGGVMIVAAISEPLDQVGANEEAGLRTKAAPRTRDAQLGPIPAIP